MEPIYIFGHKNPDTDAICSAIAYAFLKNSQASGYIPARLGTLNRETQFVLNNFETPEPLFLPHIYVRAEDIMTRRVISAPLTSTIYEVGQLIDQHKIHAVPIVDERGRALGVVTERTLVRNYLKELHVQGLQDSGAEIANIVETLEGRLVVGDPGGKVKGNVVIGAMSPEAMVNYISPGDLVILGNRENAQEAALSAQICCLVVTGNFNPSPRIQSLAQQQGAAIIVTPHDTFATARLINLSLSVSQLLDKEALVVAPETLIKEIGPDLLQSESAIALVTDDEGGLAGVLTKSDLVSRHRRRVILVDHSERSQSVEGIEQAEILEILDHHRLGGLQTSEPILALISPVGCTATLVLRRYKELGLAPLPQIAGLMVGAILSDTMLLKSPTTTPEDVAAVEYLGQVLGEDPLAFGRRMYQAKFDLATLAPEEIASSDLKTFVFGNVTVGIGQVEVADKTPVLGRKAELLEAMRRFQMNHNFDLMLLMVSDILLEGTELLAVGQTRLVEKAFGASLREQALWLPGVLSRKKQVVPPISRVI